MYLDFILYRIEGFVGLMSLDGNKRTNRGEKEEIYGLMPESHGKRRKRSLGFHLEKR